MPQHLQDTVAVRQMNLEDFAKLVKRIEEYIYTIEEARFTNRFTRFWQVWYVHGDVHGDVLLCLQNRMCSCSDQVEELSINLWAKRESNSRRLVQWPENANDRLWSTSSRNLEFLGAWCWTETQWQHGEKERRPPGWESFLKASSCLRSRHLQTPTTTLVLPQRDSLKLKANKSLQVLRLFTQRLSHGIRYQQLSIRQGKAWEHHQELLDSCHFSIIWSCFLTM